MHKIDLLVVYHAIAGIAKIAQGKEKGNAR